MKKISCYEKTKFVDEKEKIFEITLLITNGNEKHLKKCLDDPAFINSLGKIGNKEEPERIRVKVGIVNLYKEE